MSATLINGFAKINQSEASLYEGFTRASHVLLFAKTEKLSVINSSRKATILMQMRFDGHIGFPGGLIEEGETPEEGVNRECLEEIGWRGNVTPDDLLFVHIRKTDCFLSYFFAKELSEDTLNNVIKSSIESRDFGYESYGPIIVPLYTMSDQFRGFPAFLTNNFIGNAKIQLTDGITALGILSEHEVKTALAVKDPRCA